MNEQKPLKVIAGAPDRPLIIGDIEIECYVLEDETRVLSQRGLQTALGMSPGGGKIGGRKVVEFIDILERKGIDINDLIARANNPIEFQPITGRTAYGYPAILLVDVCNVVLTANDAGILRKNQIHIAERGEMLVRGLAAVGIIALVDEATGYQRIREERSLASILEKIISQEWHPWTKTFPFSFYYGIIKLKGWPPIYTVKRPGIIGRYTNSIVYERIEDGLYEELRKRNPKLPSGYRKTKHHQWFTPEYGEPLLKEHIAGASALMRAAPNWKSFYETSLPRAFPKKREQIPSPDMEN